MKKLSKLLLVVLLVLCIGSLLVACDDPTPEPADPVVTSIAVSGQKTAFLTGDDFATGDMVVTITYDDDSTQTATADQIVVDSSKYVKDTAGTYKITVTLKDTAFSQEYDVVVSNRTYSVVAGSGITVLSGVTNGTTLLGETITFKAVPGSNKHLVAVKVNGTAVEAGEGDVYSISTSTYLTSNDASIQISMEDEVHSYESVVTAPKCDEGGYTTYTCSCGDSYVDDETVATNLVADLSRWDSEAMQMEAIDGGVKVTQNRNDTWYFNTITLNIDVEQHKYLVLDFDSLTSGKVLIQFNGTQDANKKGFTVGGTYAYSLEELGISASGEYTLSLYIEGAQNTSFVIRELSLVGAQDATVHNYGSATTATGNCHLNGTSVKTCADCGAVHTDIVTEAKFLMANTGLWAGPTLQLSYANNAATLVPKGDPSWGGSVWREVTLKTTDYIRFAGAGTFKVELKSANAEVGTVIIAEKAYNGEVVIVPVSSVVTEDGAYTIIVYGIGAKDSVHTVKELFILSSADENVHSLGDWAVDGDSRTCTCSVCGVTETQNKVSVTFNADNGQENAVVKVWPGDKASTPETAPTKQGYVFSKWQLGDADFSFDSAITESITLKAIYAPATDTAYKIEYYGQKKADGEYELIHTADLTGTTGATVNADTTYVPTDAELKYYAEHTNNVLSGEVAADGTLVLKVYYKYEFTVTFKKGENTFDTKKVAWGETVTQATLDTEPGYTFAWYKGDVAFDFNTKITESITLTQTKLAATNTAYSVEYYVQSKTDGTYSVAKTDNKEGTTATVAQANSEAYTPNDAELKFDANKENVLSGVIAADGSLVLKVYYSYEFTVTFKKGEDTVDTKKVAWGETVTQATLDTEPGYTFAWAKEGANFEFATQIKESITLTQTKTANTNTAYKINAYVQGADGEYTLQEVAKTGTTDTSVTLDGSEYTPDEHLYFDAEHEGNVLTGTIAGDGSLVLKAYYSYKQVVAYSLDGIDCAQLIVTFDAVDDGKMALLELRNASNEQVGKVYASVASNVATFDVSNLDLDGKYAVITVDGVSPAITSVVTKDNVIASANPFELLATKGSGTYNGIAVNGPAANSSGWVDGYGFKSNANGTIVYKGEGGFDRGVVTVSVLSFCGSGGNDKIFIKNGSDQDVGSLGKDAYGVVASKDISFTGNATTLKFIAYVYCAGAGGWEGCPGDPETIAAHGQEWCRIDKVVYYKEFTLQSTKLLAINGKEAEYIAPAEIVRYESKFYGDLQSINVAVSSGTSAQINIYENGLKIGETLSANVNDGVAKFDVTSLNLANTAIQIEVLGDATVSNINLDTTDYINVGKALYNGCIDYHGGMAIKNTADWMQMDEEGKFRAGKWHNDRLFVFDFANIKDNLVKLDFIGKCFSVCNDGGNERMFLMSINNGNNETICGPKNGTADSTENVKNLSLEKSKLGDKTTCDVKIQLGCNNSNATTKAEHLAKEYLTLEITATLSYTATAVTLYN